MSMDYFKDIDGIMSKKLKDWILIIKKDRCYIRGNHEIEWSEIRAEIIKFIKEFIFDILGVDGEYIYFEPIRNKKENSINSFIIEIETLILKFQKSPPFTIYYLTRILNFDDNFNCLKFKIDEKFNGLKSYNKKTIDLIRNTETNIIVNNIHYEEDLKIKLPSMNEIYAIKFLKLLIKCLKVESNCDDVINDMKYYKSTNLIG